MRRQASRASSNPLMAMPEVERLQLEWQELSCWYSTSGANKWVLKGVYGCAQPSEMQAVMGPSGAGKSTLMDILAQRKSTGHLGGALLVDGKRADATYIRKTAYVPQEDNFVPVMTLLETLQFYAGIILPRHWSGARRAARVQEVMREMGLAGSARTLVGGLTPGGLVHRGLSGGERKRLSIATGILAAPSVVFLDEPTTGLDSFAALTVMSYMKRMAQENGHIVITCIHQPRSAIWSMFDTVTLLSCGRLMYTGICDGLVEWLRGIGFDYDASVHGVVSDWALDLVAIGTHKPTQYFGQTITNMREVRTLSAHFLEHWLERRSGGAAAAGEDLMLPQGQTGSRGPVVTVARAADTSSSILGPVATAAATPAIRSWDVRGGHGSGGSPQMNSGSSSPSSGSHTSGSHTSGRPVLGRVHHSSGTGGNIRAPSPSRSPSRLQRYERERDALRKPSTWTQQCCWIYRREFLTITRNPSEVAGRTLCNAWVAAAMGMMFWSLADDFTSLRSKINMMLNMLAFFCLMPYVSMSLYSAGRKSYLADVSAKLYSPSAYYIAKVRLGCMGCAVAGRIAVRPCVHAQCLSSTLDPFRLPPPPLIPQQVAATLPFQLISSLTFTFVLYGMAGLRNSPAAIWEYAAITTVLALIAVQVR